MRGIQWPNAICAGPRMGPTPGSSRPSFVSVTSSISLTRTTSSRDAHVKSTDFLDVEVHPQIIFRGASVSHVHAGCVTCCPPPGGQQSLRPPVPRTREEAANVCQAVGATCGRPRLARRQNGYLTRFFIRSGPPTRNRSPPMLRRPRSSGANPRSRARPLTFSLALASSPETKTALRPS